MNAVNSLGDKVSKACCHVVRIGLSVVVIGCEGVREEVMGVIFSRRWSVACELVVDHPRVSRIIHRVLRNRCCGVDVTVGC